MNTEAGFHLGGHRDSREEALPCRLWWLEECGGQLALGWMFHRRLMFLQRLQHRKAECGDAKGILIKHLLCARVTEVLNRPE